MAGLLEGLRVLALDQVVAGPYGSRVLADNGAEVIKIERPGLGEVGRALTEVPAGPKGVPVNLVTTHLNRNKKGITLNLKDERGRQVFRELVRISDVVWENLEPGTLQGLGLGFEDLRRVNPSLIYVSISGFGQPGPHGGPYWQRPAYDVVIQAMSGLMFLPGKPDDPPTWLGMQIGDQYPALMAVAALMMALYNRDRTGQGRHIDLAMYEAAVTLAERYIALLSFTGQSPVRRPERSSQVGMVRAKDGYLVVGIVSQEVWPNLCEVIGRPDLLDDPRFNDPRVRIRNREALRDEVEKWSLALSRDEAVQALLNASVPTGPVQTLEEVVACRHLEARGFWTELEVPGAGSFKVAGNPIKATGVDFPKPTPTPRLGQHTDEVLTGLLGMSAEEVARLREAGVV